MSTEAAAGRPALPPQRLQQSLRVLLLGASGTAGLATAQALSARGHCVLALLRPTGPGRAGANRLAKPDDGADRLAGLAGLAALSRLPGLQLAQGDVCRPGVVARLLQQHGPFDAVLSCLASRSGVAADAWAVDHGAHHHALLAAREAGVARFVLLSAICVQKPRLAFQQAKLAFERELCASPLAWSIVRPTALFKSLSGQVQRVRDGRPFLLFGDGRATACRPIADADLADYLVDCLEQPALQHRVLPIGGPGPAITPREQGEMLFELLGRAPRWRSVSPRLLDGVCGLLGLGERWVPAWARAAELARIGRYYATESMLVWDAVAGRYRDEATPATGQRTLRDHYRQLLAGQTTVWRGAHAVF